MVRKGKTLIRRGAMHPSSGAPNGKGMIQAHSKGGFLPIALIPFVEAALTGAASAAAAYGTDKALHKVGGGRSGMTGRPKRGRGGCGCGCR